MACRPLLSAVVFVCDKVYLNMPHISSSVQLVDKPSRPYNRVKPIVFRVGFGLFIRRFLSTNLGPIKSRIFSSSEITGECLFDWRQVISIRPKQLFGDTPYTTHSTCAPLA